MQYLLTEQEYKELKNNESDALKKIKSDLQKVCTYSAMNSPCDRNYDKNDKSPWGCVLVKGSIEYCDDCPVKSFCPSNYKRWSK